MMSLDSSFSEALCRFAVDLYSRIIKNQSTHLTNVFWSPLSVHASLSMVMSGADGTTKQEIINALHVPDNMDESKAHELFGSAIVNSCKSSEGVEVAVANRLFLLQSAVILAEYSQMLSKYYSAETESLVGSSSVEEKRIVMNKWVAEVTKGKINDLIPPGALSHDTVVTIMNALYFKGLWKHQFEKKRTLDSKFHLLNGGTIDVPMMYVKARLPHFFLADLDANAIRLPFMGPDWEMLITFTSENDKLPDLLTYLSTPGNLKELLNAEYDVIEMELFLPKFRLSEAAAMDVKELLKECGITTVFDRARADLSRLCSSDKLFVSAFLHKAVLEVDEEGATAAAATVVAVNFKAALRTPTFRVDHPFFITLVYKSNIPAFIGHIVTPEKF